MQIIYSNFIIAVFGATFYQNIASERQKRRIASLYKENRACAELQAKVEALVALMLTVQKYRSIGVLVTGTFLCEVCPHTLIASIAVFLHALLFAFFARSVLFRLYRHSVGVKDPDFFI